MRINVTEIRHSNCRPTRPACNPSPHPPAARDTKETPVERIFIRPGPEGGRGTQKRCAAKPKAVSVGVLGFVLARLSVKRGWGGDGGRGRRSKYQKVLRRSSPASPLALPRSPVGDRRDTRSWLLPTYTHLREIPEVSARFYYPLPLYA